MQKWDISGTKELVAVARDAPPTSSSIGSLIRWLLANGYTMAQIRAMHPGWFSAGANPRL
jgi:hypothetical protein